MSFHGSITGQSISPLSVYKTLITYSHFKQGVACLPALLPFFLFYPNCFFLQAAKTRKLRLKWISFRITRFFVLFFWQLEDVGFFGLFCFVFCYFMSKWTVNDWRSGRCVSGGNLRRRWMHSPASVSYTTRCWNIFNLSVHKNTIWTIITGITSRHVLLELLKRRNSLYKIMETP